MKKTLLLLVLTIALNANAQDTDNLFTIVTKYSSDFGGSTRMGNVNPAVGFVNNVGTATSPNLFSVTGGSVNQTTNRFNLVSTNFFMSFDLFDGSIQDNLPINSFFEGTTLFSNVRYNNSNNTLYGLASTFTENNELIGMYLASLNTETGDLTALSQNSVGNGYQLAGTAVNPLEMVYYYSTGPQFVGLDLYNGTIYSNPTIQYSNPYEFNFTNFAYNCADDTMYGLVTEDTQVPNPNSPSGVSIYAMRFGKINTTTGEVTNISDVPLPTSYYSASASSTIDPNTNTYYYSDGNNIYGISLLTGLVVSTAPLVFEDGQNINMMINYNNCLGAIATRQDPALSVPQNTLEDKITVYPNPTSTTLSIDAPFAIDSVEVIDSNGRTVKADRLDSNKLQVQHLQSGVYFLKIVSNNLVKNIKFVKI
ncbi:T9SS type A sorting domain-containing protein [Flavobacterium sp.]|uniref:T9SS type A sorting domain-containing protein n=1 Tax=Flavobacterium sp. TaxID=239 RepID=UPI0025BE9D7A|nr:T9SS type A sorting domain-containing protein [Flavobacterium sp.]